MTHKGTLPLKTQRLILRKFAETDCDMLFNNFTSDEKVTQFLSWSHHENIKQTKKLISDIIKNYTNEDYYNWAIEFEGEVIGNIALNNVSNKSWRADLSYSIGSKWWNKGIVGDAVKEVFRFAFEQVKFHKILALHDCENIASGRIMEKNGMRLEGVLKLNTRRLDGTFSDVNSYGILIDEWTEKNK